MPAVLRNQLFVGIGTAVGAFATAAMLTSATAPTARADDLGQILDGVNADLADGQAAFTTAYSDFAGGDFLPGLAALFGGVDDDFVSVPDNLTIGSVEALTNEGIINSALPFVFSAPTSFADAETVAQDFMEEGQAYFAQAATLFASGDYGDTVYSDLLGADLVGIAPLQELILGSLTTF